MIALNSLKPMVVVTQVVLTFGAAQLAGLAVAAHYQQDQVNTANAAISSADQAFETQVKLVLADGTPHSAVDPVVAMRQRLRAETVPTANLLIDRLRIDALNKRAADTQALTRQVAATETQVEVTIHQQLVAAIKTLRDEIDAAKAIGVDTGADATFADATETANAQLLAPLLEQQTIDDLTSRTATVQQAMAAKIAADETARQAARALASARTGAQSALQTAQAALARAQAIPVLKVSDAQAAIDALSQTLSQDLANAASSIDQFQALSQQLRSQAAGLNNLVDTRQATYDLLALTRRELDAAQAAKNDVSAERAQVEALAPQLDAAGDINTISSIKNQVQAIKNAIDAKYLAALYGAGRVIVVSTDQERLVALQDGVIVLNTLVTTGRPSLPTLNGVFHILAKFSPYCMRSPWPPSSRYYWPGCAKMSYAMLWESSGYFIHDAPWRHSYGPGSDTEGGGTHGCVNVMLPQMTWLYNWTPMGATVITKPGDIPG